MRGHVVIWSRWWLVILALTGCSAANTLDYGPFYSKNIDPKTGRTEIKVPFLLSRFVDDPANDFEETQILWPFVRSKREGRETEKWIFPFHWDNKHIDRHGLVDHDWAWGLVFGGDSKDYGPYFAVFPIGGVMKGYLGKDVLAPILFPLYLYMRDGDFKSHHLIWPFINWVEGGGRSGGRFLPLFAHYNRYGKSGKLTRTSTSILWPFISFDKRGMDTKAGPTSTFMFFPFYGSVDGPRVKRRTYLWPFFSYKEVKPYNKSEVASIRRKGVSNLEWEIKAPFPFVTLAGGPGQKRVDIWPFYGYKHRYKGSYPYGKYSRFERQFVLWPVIRTEHHETHKIEESRSWFLPFWSHYETRSKKTGKTKKSWKVWPFVSYKKNEIGEVTVNILSPLWFKDPTGFEAIYEPIFRIYHRYTDKGGRYQTRMLWGIYGDYEDKEGGTGVWLHPFFSHEKKPAEQYKRYSYFFDLFQYIQRGDDRAMRFFWLPEWPTWKVQPKAKKTAKRRRRRRRRRLLSMRMR